MRVIIIGVGDVGRHIAETLSNERHNVTVVDGDPERISSAQRELDVLAIVGNGASPRFLEGAGVGDADLLCAVTQSDEVNLIAALAGHQLGARGPSRACADDEYFDADQSLARDVLGIDFVIHPERATAENLAEAILLPGLRTSSTSPTAASASPSAFCRCGRR